MPQKKPSFSIKGILTWADLHHRRTGQWPKMAAGPIVDAPLGENWRKVDNALRHGLRGLSGGSSLARLLDEKRGVRNVHDLPPVATKMILTWADLHHKCTGKWPNENSGPVIDALGEKWWDRAAKESQL
jgi:hypothetical protein